IPGLSIAPSDIVTLTVDSYKTATPAGTFNSSTRLLTITCATEGATILYTFDREGEWTPYTEPIAIDGNVTVYAKATRDGYNDSDIAEIVISDMKCAGVSFSYNGRYLRIETGEPEASIRYTTDGTEPSVGMEYSGEFDAEGLCTIRAVAVKPGYMNSDVTEFAINRYADEEHAETSAGGLLASAFEWDDSDLPNSVETFRVEGRLNEADYRFIRSMEALRHLDIEKVVDAHIPEYAFRNTRLISISLPAEITEYGDSILAETPTLSSVIWNSGNIDVKEGLTQSLANPNVLLYVPAEASVSDPSGLNIIKDGIDASVTLHYGHPYYAARDFHAGRVSLTHEFLQTTRVDTCRGWETIVLPFTPTGMTHEVNGPIVPFAVWNEDVNGDKPFWLYSSTENGWEAGSSIQACVPYIISMPNNPDYVSEFNLGGKVTFSAEDVDLGPDSSFAESCPWVEGTRFEGTFMPVEETGLLSLNVNAPEDPYMQPGSAFVPDATTVPFGAYVRGATGRRAMPLFGDGSGVSLPTVTDSGLVVETPAPGMLRISGTRECNV
ncbi:MAG: chitobiase/beta-hexosaminidase C-terminal domain-containing protein, partial [Muribaculaceae bacterium]|nr:chitobiase/beta-hexosaminidase C-terminal domain-containing protein [Muribaculaceae bacterium]